MYEIVPPPKKAKIMLPAPSFEPTRSNGDVPGYRGRMWCSCGIGGEKLLAIKEGNIISDPSPDVFSTW